VEVIQVNKRSTSVLAIAAIVLSLANFFVLAGTRMGMAQSSPSIPELISYQGRLTDPAGNPLTGDYAMRFCLYAAPSGGTALWCEETTVAVSYGVFSLLLGSVTPIPETVFDGSDLYLGVKVGSDAEMTPRRRVVSVGYAYRAEAAVDADTVDGLHASDFEDAGAVSTHAADPAAHHTRYSDAEAVTAIKAADGSGSGLDADMVDGLHASSSPAANALLPLDAGAQLPASVVPLRVYDSGWFEVSIGNTYVKTHNLGTTTVWSQMWFSQNADGSAPVLGYPGEINSSQVGAQLRNITDTQITYDCSGHPVASVLYWDGYTVYTSGYARIIMWALE
jgi:hypothetical protein